MPVSRRTLLGAGMSVVGLGTLRSSPFEDADADGIPDAIERSDEYDRFVRDRFGDEQFEGLEPHRRDLLIDARYVGSATISGETKRFVRDAFRDHGIYLQWLDYPVRYPVGSFAEQYGDRVERILWPIASFYADEIEEELRDTALQVIVLPDSEENLEALYAIQQGQHFDGMSFGNRCLVTASASGQAEMVLVMHEIGHLALCHNEDPASVMSANPDQARFTTREWARLREGLSNIRDTSGFDIATRKCLLERYRETAGDMADDIPEEYAP